MQYRKRHAGPDLLRRTRRHLQSRLRRRTRLRRHRRRHRCGSPNPALRRLPPNYLGILRRRPGPACQSKRESRTGNIRQTPSPRVRRIVLVKRLEQPLVISNLKKGDMTTNLKLIFPNRQAPGFISRLYQCSAVFICGVFALFFLFFAAPPTPAQEKVDLLITGGTVITMDAQRRVLEDGAVAIRADSIVAVGPRTELEAKYAAAKAINAHG